MSDSFSIASGAFGVVSLAIKIYEGLVSYIGDVKDAKEKCTRFPMRWTS